MIILLIGTSSTGKTTLSKHLQAELPGYWQYMGLDLTFKGIPADYAGGDDGRYAELGFAYADRDADASIIAGEWGHRVLEGMIGSAFEMDYRKVNVIFDDMLLDEKHAAMWRERLSEVEHLIVCLVASEEILLERISKRSTPNGVALNHIVQNKLIDADLEIDTGTVSTEDAAQRVIGLIKGKKIYQLAGIL